MKVTIEVNTDAFIGFVNQIEITPNGVFFNFVNTSGDTFNLGTGELVNSEKVFGKSVEP